MKVISQLIRHFWQSGLLSLEEVESLLREGFARPRDLSGYVPPKRAKAKRAAPVEGPAVVIEAPTALDEVEETLIRRTAARRAGRGGGKRSAAKVPAPRVIARKVRAELDERAAALEALIPLARVFENVQDASEALVMLRDLPAAAWEHTLAVALRRQPAQLDALWQALSPVPFLNLLNDDGWQGTAANAYTVLLMSPDRRTLGRYQWILRSPALATLANVLDVSQGFLRALGGLFSVERSLVRRAVKHARNAEIVWPMLLVYNAARIEGVPSRRMREYGPIELPLGIGTRRVWTTALEIDHGRTLKLFERYCASQASRRENPVPELMCPSEWHLPAII